MLNQCQQLLALRWYQVSASLGFLQYWLKQIIKVIPDFNSIIRDWQLKEGVEPAVFQEFFVEADVAGEAEEHQDDAKDFWQVLVV